LKFQAVGGVRRTADEQRAQGEGGKDFFQDWGDDHIRTGEKKGTIHPAPVLGNSETITA